MNKFVKFTSGILLFGLLLTSAGAYNLNTAEKSKGDLIISKLDSAALKRKGDKVKFQAKYITALNKLKAKSKNEQLKSLIDYIVAGFGSKNYGEIKNINVNINNIDKLYKDISDDTINFIPYNLSFDDNFNIIGEFKEDIFNKIKSKLGKDKMFYGYVVYSKTQNDIISEYSKKLDESFYKFENINKDGINFVKVTLDTKKLLTFISNNLEAGYSISIFGLFNSENIDDQNILRFSDSILRTEKDYSKNNPEYNLLLKKNSNGKIYFKKSSNISRNSKLHNKYKSYFKEDSILGFNGEESSYIFDIKDKDLINKFLSNYIISNLFSLNEDLNNNNTNLYKKNDSDYYIVSNKKNISNIQISTDYLDTTIECGDYLSDDNKKLGCMNGNYIRIEINKSDIITNDNKNSFINISKIYKTFKDSNIDINKSILTLRTGNGIIFSYIPSSYYNDISSKILSIEKTNKSSSEIDGYK